MAGSPGRRRALDLAVLTLLLIGVMVPATPGSADHVPIVYPEVAGTTTIHWEGVTGIVLRFPEDARIKSDDLALEAGEGTKYMWTGFRAKSWEELPDNTICDFCLRSVTEFVPEYRERQFTPGSCTDEQGNDVGCPYDAGLHELYMISDGPATLTVELDDLSGSTELTATADVDGLLKRLPVRGCDPLPDCSQGFAYGGESREIGLDGRPAIGWVRAYVKAPPGPVADTNPGVRGLQACAYPSSVFQASSSGDPEDHPRGCDDEAIPSVNVAGGGGSPADLSWEIHGEQYLGFAVWNRHLEEAVFGVWAFWLESGITCGSHDYHDCTKPSPED